MESKVQAQDLKQGDYLPLTKATVMRVSRAGLKIPSGKVEIVLQAGSNTRGLRTVLWGKSTEIVVERKGE
jgi:hypothetical protein